MLEKFRESKTKKAVNKKKELREVGKRLNVNDEYLSALRTKSYSKAQQQYYCISSDPWCCNNLYLEPGQDSIPAILESALILSKTPKLKTLMLNYFDISAEASSICTQLLKSIKQFQCDSDCIFEPNIVNSSELLNSSMHEKYSSVLQCLNKMRKKVSKKMKLISYFQKASGICVTAAFGVVAVAAMVVAAHTLTALFVGPALALGSFPFKELVERLSSSFSNFFMFRSDHLRKVGDQLDSAAKGIYILKREFETMSRLVTRLNDSVDHNKVMTVRSCQSKFCNDQLVNELKKSDLGLRKQVEELEEHVFLCLVTINRARALLINHIVNPKP